MRTRLQLLDQALLDRILGEAFALLMEPGVRVQAVVAQQLLAAHGATVADGVARIPEPVIRAALATVPREFVLYDRDGNRAVEYGRDAVQFDPGSSCVHVLDPDTLQHRESQAADLVRLIQVAELLPAYAAQSTAMVCADVPSGIGDLYRLFLVLWYSGKPVVTGAFSATTTQRMIDLLAADAGGLDALQARPRAIFDVCPSPPLHWSDFAGENLVQLARADVPAEIISVPLAGATAPVTLAGAVVQHAAECLTGIVIHQLARPGARVVWGGAPAIFDMRSGNAPMGAIETAMLDAACSQVGKSLGLPTHGYLCGSDAKVVDAQAGLETGMAALIGVLAGINMISGAGMLDFLACHSAEKLVIDAEAIGMAQRLGRGIEPRGTSLALEMFAKAGLSGEFLKLRETRALFREEQFLPSPVIDRLSFRAWEEAGASDSFTRARARVAALLRQYRRPELGAAREAALRAIMEREAMAVGLTTLPGI
ncbi:MAG: trimethylamine methyltransferase family protein [Gemmatimonadota bacterium]|nr:trimethylamine methyltransferase family protein [Gemmatimonadota bacterium]